MDMPKISKQARITKNETETQIYGVPAVERAIKLLRSISEGESIANLSHAAKLLGINRTTLIRLLASLEAGRFVEKKPYGVGYQIGPGLIGVAAQTFMSRDLSQTALPYLIMLSETYGLSAHLGILEGRDVLYLLRQVPNVFRASAIRVGSRLPAHATTMGRIILAYLPERDVRSLFAGADLTPVTESTATRIDDLIAQIAQDRQIGLAWSASYYEPGVDSFAAPIFDHSGLVVAAINISGPEAAFSIEGGKRARIGESLRRAAMDISERLGFVPNGRSHYSLEGTLA
ncbi:IclR family transcriptional regulator [Acidiphilium sp. AL]|nr:IclR family transcriptional regulator [Acidiphilium sp. AL]